MKSSLIIFSCLLFFWGCKKKEEDPQPTRPDELVYETTFDDPTWQARIGRHYTSTYNASEYKLSVDTLGWLGYEIAPTNDLTYNYIVQVDATILLDDESKLGYAGFIYNYINAQNYCVVNVGTNGIFYINQIEDGTSQILVYNTVSKDLLKGSGQTNTIALRQYNNSLVLILNGVHQGTLPFKRPTTYFRVGLEATSSTDYYTPTVALFDNFSIKKIY